jgi:hypothetical protein
MCLHHAFTMMYNQRQVKVKSFIIQCQTSPQGHHTEQKQLFLLMHTAAGKIGHTVLSILFLN